MKPDTTGRDPFLDVVSGETRAEPNAEKTSVDWEPFVDILETDEEYLVKAELPKVHNEDVLVAIENGALVISGERKFPHEEHTKKHRFHRIERRFGKFQRIFQLPEAVDTNHIEANFRSGVLTVHLKKCSERNSQRVEINVL